MGKYLEKSKAIFLDRDGVINKPKVIDGKPFPPNSLEEFEFTEGIEPLIKQIKQKKFKCIIITNQPDVSRGEISKHVVNDIHNHIFKNLPIDEIYVCWDAEDNISNLKKPLPGMLFKAAEDHNINLNDSYMVGDRWKDIDAGSRAGCKTIFIDYNYDEKLNIAPDYIISDVREALKIIN